MFTQGGRADFDAVVLGTGFKPRRDRFLDLDLLDDAVGPPTSGQELASGLCTCGFYVSPTGMLREIGIEARRIGDHIARSLVGGDEKI